MNRDDKLLAPAVATTAIGALLNLAVVVSNHGFMPVANMDASDEWHRPLIVGVTKLAALADVHTALGGHVYYSVGDAFLVMGVVLALCGLVVTLYEVCFK